MTHTDSQKQSFWFIFQDDLLLFINNPESNKLVTEKSIHAYQPYFIRQYKLAEFEHYIVHCAELHPEAEVSANNVFVPLKKALEMLGQDWYTLAAKAFAIINWDKNHQFCGRCAAQTIHVTDTFERKCPVCLLAFYPRISPSMIVLIHKEDHLLMARSAHFPPGVYGLIAGFVEAGESIEETVHREVKEEVGLEIDDLHYFGSQAWPFPDSLMIAFTARYKSGELIINPVEIETAGWYRYDQLPGRPSTSVSIARKLIDHFVAEQTHKALK